MRFLRHSIMGLFLLGVAVALVLYAGQIVTSAVQSQMAQDSPARPARERVFAVNVVEAQAGPHTPVLEAFGRIESRRRLELRAPVPGRVDWLSEGFQNGGFVAQGAVLVEIDKADASAAVALAEADRAEASAQARDAERALILARDELETTRAQAALRARAFDRQRDLLARGVGSEAQAEVAELAAAQANQAVITRRQAMSQAEARLDQVKSQLTRADIALDEARRDLADATVTAPFAGTLQGVTLVEGRLVATNEILAELVDPGRLEVAFRLSTLQYARLLGEEGQLVAAPVRVALDHSGAGLVALGVLSRASGAVGAGETGRLLYARLDGARGVQPGDFVIVRVEEPQISEAILLPSAALNAQNSVLVLGPEGRLQEASVTLLRRQGDRVLVAAPDLEGRQIVARRTPLLGEGIKVRALNQEADAQSAGGPPKPRRAGLDRGERKGAAGGARPATAGRDG